MGSGGYTLIELLIVIAIIALLSLVGFVNFKDFAAEQVAVKAKGQIQTLLRLAQGNATTSTLCNTHGAVSWSLKFTNAVSIELHCEQASTGDFLQRSYTLENAQVAISGSGCSLSMPVTLRYSTGVGTLTVSPSDVCTSIMFRVSNTRNTSASVKTFTISRGGAIDVQ